MTDSVTLRHTFGSIKRDGQWTVPELIVLRQRMGSASLDFTGADFAGAQIELRVDMFGGSIEVRVPPEVTVTSQLSTTLASYQDHRPGNPADSVRTLTITGQATWGSVEVRGPKKALWGR
jgi:hypothetical protein